MSDTERALQQLRELLASQLFCVLATHGGGQPYANLVAFVATDDLSQLVFATSRGTRKYGNMRADPRVAMMVDSRSNRQSDIRDAVVATALGTVEEAEGDDRARLVRLYLDKHPDLEEFVSSPQCALLVVKIDRYYLVSHFQNVVELTVPR